jgi:transposase, IS30 family
MAKHLTLQERGVLRRLLLANMPKMEVAKVMQRDPSTIYREIARNSGARGYRAKQAQALADERRKRCRRPCKLEDPKLHRYVKQGLQNAWSPDQIAGRMAREFPRQPRRTVSRQTIYNWINGRAEHWRALLRRGGRPPERRGKLADIVRIQGRPDVINRRRRFGDWEGDTLVGKGRRSGLLTLVERKSGFARIGRLNDLRAATTTRMACRCLREFSPSLRRSVTFDNGKEFMEHRKLTRRLELPVYFADPYRSWQRGTSENTNGLLRQFFPKRTDFTRVGHREVARVEQLLNERPRRRHDYRTPVEVLAHRLSCN